MTYTGHIENGVVVFDGPSRPPDGTIVRIEEVSNGEPAPTWAEVFRDFIGVIDDLPEDMAENHDHYIHGTPKRPPSNG